MKTFLPPPTTLTFFILICMLEFYLSYLLQFHRESPQLKCSFSFPYNSSRSKYLNTHTLLQDTSTEVSQSFLYKKIKLTMDIFKSLSSFDTILISTIFIGFFIYMNRKVILSNSVLSFCYFVRILIEDFLLCVLTTCWMLFFGLGYGVCLVWKGFLFVYLKVKYGPLGDTLDCVDAIGIVENANSSVNITSLEVLQGPCDIENIRRRVAVTAGKKNSSGKLVFPKFYQILDEVSGYCCWKPAAFDIEHHVRFIDNLNELSPSLSETQVLKMMNEIASRQFQSQRSPWEILLIPKFHYENEDERRGAKTQSKFGMVIRIHHGIADGYSLLKLIIRDTTLPGDETVNCPVPQSPPKAPMPFWKGTLVFLYLTLRSARALYVEMLSRDDNPLFRQGKMANGQKVMVWSQPINIQFLKEVKTKLGVGLSTTLITALTSSVQKYITQEFKEPSKSLSALIPFPAPNHPDNKMTNKFSLVRLSLPCSEEDPSKALPVMDRRIKKLAVSPDGPMNLLLLQLMGVLPTKLIRQLLQNKQSTLVVSNIPGPSERISIWGSQLLDTMFWLPTLGTSGISASFLSYKTHFRLGLTIDTGIIKDGNVGGRRLVDGFTEAILSLAKEANVSSQNAFPSLTIPYAHRPRRSRSLNSRVVIHTSEESENESETETSGHYSCTSSDIDAGSGDECSQRTSGEPALGNSNFSSGDFCWNLRKRFISSSTLQCNPMQPSVASEEHKTLLRSNSVNSRLCRTEEMGNGKAWRHLR